MIKFAAKLTTLPATRPRSPRLLRLRARALDWLAANRAALTQALALVITLRLVILVVGYLALSFLPESDVPIITHHSKRAWIDMWVRWDAVHYLNIANEGYAPGSDELAFFPLYPFLMRVLALLTFGNAILSGLLVATLAYIVGLFYLRKLVEHEFDADLAARTVLYVAVSPLAFFFLSLYTEPMFLAFTAGAIYHARRSQWLAAGLLGALACFTRPNGILLLVPLLYEAFRQWRSDQIAFPIKRVIVALSLLPGAILAWMAYLYALTGDALAFIHAQSSPAWERTFSLPWNTLLAGIRYIVEAPPRSYARSLFSVDAAVTLLLLLAIALSFRYLPRVYGLYLAVSVVVLLTSTTEHEPLFSMPRFALVLFPAFMLLAMAGRNAHIHRFILILFLTLLGLYTAMFVNWYWIA